MRPIGRWLAAVPDGADYLLTVARLSMLDWLHPAQETPVDRAIRKEGERLRQAFPTIDFDNPGARRSRSSGAGFRRLPLAGLRNPENPRHLTHPVFDAFSQII
jgi:hypothetical protein